MKFTPLLLVIAALFTSCQDDPKKFLPESQGTHNDMMVVLEDEEWESALGDLIRDRLAKPVQGLTQSEPLFNLYQVEDAAFGDLFQRYKSIVIFRVIPDSTDFRIVKDQWSSPQLIASLVAPDKVSLARLFNENKDEIIERFRAHDSRVLTRRIARTAKVNVPDELGNMGIESIVLPDAFSATVTTDSLVVFYSEYQRTNQAIFFHIRPLRDDVLPGTDLIEVRDSILKNYFEGPSEGSYPGTEMRIPPSISTTEIDGKLAFELRGRWKTFGDFMGGPFISYAIIDEDRNSVITADAFMYGPDVKKHKYMMELEQVLRSIRIKPVQSE